MVKIYVPKFVVVATSEGVYHLKTCSTCLHSCEEVTRCILHQKPTSWNTPACPEILTPEDMADKGRREKYWQRIKRWKRRARPNG